MKHKLTILLVLLALSCPAQDRYRILHAGDSFELQTTNYYSKSEIDATLSDYGPINDTNWIGNGLTWDSGKLVTGGSGIVTNLPEGLVYDTDPTYTAAVAKAESALQEETNTGDGSGLTNLVPTAVQGVPFTALTYTSTNLVIPFADGIRGYTVTLTNDVVITKTIANTNTLGAVHLAVTWTGGASQSWDTNHWTFIGGSAPALSSNDVSHLIGATYYREDKAEIGMRTQP
jgi:hypothetical protein